MRIFKDCIYTVEPHYNADVGGWSPFLSKNGLKMKKNGLTQYGEVAVDWGRGVLHQ